MGKEYKYLALFVIPYFWIVMTCLMLIFTGVATPFISGFAVDRSDRLYVGTQNEIRVYDNGSLVNTISPKTSSSYAFTINKHERIVLAATTTVYMMDLEGNVLDTRDDPGGDMYNQIQYRKRKFSSHSGDEYKLVGALGWTRIIKNGEETVYRISLLSFAVKILLAVCGGGLFTFTLWVAIQKAKGRLFS